MPKFKERTKKISFPVFSNYEVYVVLSSDIQKSLDKRHIKHQVSGMGLHVRYTSGASIVFLPLDPPASVVVHECWHCIFSLMKYVGAELEEEIVAYHLDYLVAKVLHFVLANK